jgi:hypothetical protein
LARRDEDVFGTGVINRIFKEHLHVRAFSRLLLLAAPSSRLTQRHREMNRSNYR